MDLQVPTRAIAAFERATGLALCIRAMDERLLAPFPPERQRYHHHAACRAAKQTRQAACVAFCGGAVVSATAERAGTVVTRCHAGYTELTAAVRDQGRPVAVLYAGLSRAGAGLRPELEHRGDRPPLAWAARLPLLSAEDAAWMGELLSQLALRLERWLASLDAPAREEPDRATEVRRWIEQNYALSAPLSGIASRLGLSSERSRHLVRELCGRGLRELVAEARLRAAATLLADSDLRVAEVARRVGMKDHGRFAAAFRRRHGIGPRDYRGRSRKP